MRWGIITNANHIQLYSLSSLKKSAITIKEYIPKVQQARRRNKDFGPVALPIFFNAGRMTEAQKKRVQTYIDSKKFKE